MDCRGNGWTSYTMLHSYILYKAKKSISLLKRLILAPWMSVYIIRDFFIFGISDVFSQFYHNIFDFYWMLWCFFVCFRFHLSHKLWVYSLITTTLLFFLKCCGDVPQNINFFNYWGTFSKLTRSFSQHTVYVICNCTPLYTFSCFLGYIFSNPCLFYAT